MDIEIVRHFLQLGFTHVIPLGFDHILFILSLFFLNTSVRSVLVQCSVFTLAHSLSLGVSAAGYVVPNPAIIEPLIALSIVFTAIENIVHSRVSPWRLLVIFGFGLVHGMGFASALREAGLPPDHFISSLLCFNLGVEFGQLAIVLAAYFLVSRWFGGKPWYKERIVYPVSSIIGCVAVYWVVERIFYVG